MIEQISQDAIFYIIAGVGTTVGGFLINSQLKIAKVITKLDMHLDQASKDHDTLTDLNRRVTILEHS